MKRSKPLKHYAFRVVLLLIILMPFHFLTAQQTKILSKLKCDPAQQSKNYIRSEPAIISPVQNDELLPDTKLRFIPDLKVIGHRASSFAVKAGKKRERCLLSSFKLFTSGIKSDTTAIYNGINLLIPQASSFGLTLDFLYVDKKTKTPSNTLSMYSTLNLLDKEVPIKGVSDFSGTASVMTFHGTFGGEYLIRDYISIYANGNLIWPFNNRETFNNFFGLDSDEAYYFFDFGIKTQLFLNGEETKDKPSSDLVSFEIGFINNAGDISTFVNTKDPFTPMFKVNYSKLFNMDMINK